MLILLAGVFYLIKQRERELAGDRAEKGQNDLSPKPETVGYTPVRYFSYQT